MSQVWRLIRIGAVAALVVWTTGWLVERFRFGASDAAAATRVEAELQQRFDRSADSLGQIASQLAGERQLIVAAPHDTGAVKRLFEAADAALPRNNGGATGITVYDASGVPLAWAGRVSELPKVRVNGPAALFVTLVEPGPRFFRIEPVVDRARLQPERLATIVVEEALGGSQGGPGSAGAFVVPTSLAPVTLRPHVGAISASDRSRFVIASRDRGALADGVVAPADLAEARARWAHVSEAAALLVLVITILLGVGGLIDFRHQTPTTRSFLILTAGVAGTLLVARAAFLAALTLVVGPRAGTSPLDLLATGLTGVALVWLALDLVERRRLLPPRPPVLTATTRSVVLIGGAYAATAVAATVLLWRYQRVLEDVVAQTTFDLLHISHDPLSASRVSLMCGLLLLHTAIIWLAATLTRLPTLVWRPSRSLARSVILLAWLSGAAVAMLAIDRIAPGSLRLGPLVVALAGAGLCAVVLGRLGARARRASQAMRLLALFLALLVPAIAMYPSLVAIAVDAQEHVIATEYGLQAVDQRLDLENRTRLALGEIDDFPALAGLFVPAADEQTPTSAQAFRVWSRTSLARYRLPSAVELYAPDGHLVSRFALILPVYGAPRLRTEACGWDLFDEPSSPGSNERHVLAASRSVCERGRVVGTIVVRSMLDYRTLPFLASATPYVDLLQPDRLAPPEGISGGDIEFVAYGWSRAPLFASGTSVWRLSDDLFQQLVTSRAPFWVTIDRDDEPFRVYFLNDRAGIYAIGYPVITWFGHLINLFELGTLTFALYVLLLAAATLINVLTSRTPASGRALLREIRSSFYRKLALAFVACAVVPVVILAIATRTYFATELRASIEDAAARTATVAQRLVEDYAALQQRGSSALEAIDDQIMVLVRRAIDQDVNLYDRSRLQATSERDVFESQLLPMRTPANVYRAIALEHLPTFVVEKEEGGFAYRVAAAAVRAGGREGIVTVPLPLRQQEIEQQIDQLDHRVLFAAVLFSLLGAALGYWMAERIADPVNRLTRATRRIARGDLDARIAATSSDELRRLVEDFNQMAADLQRQRADLERTQRLEAWAEMARQVAHDIKNPLTPIQLSAEHARRINLDRGRPLSPVLDDCVNAILTQVRLLRQIAGEFSSFASSPTPRPEATVLTDLVEEVIHPYRTGLTGRIAIETQASPDLPKVYIDRTLFSRALTNVIENALHAMPGMGRLSILESARDGAVAVEVRDSGIGMDPQSLAKVFEPYFSTKTSGTGLGLTIAKRNIELSGGTISVASERGVGTSVTMTVPIADMNAGEVIDS